MFTLFIVLHVIFCIFLILVILLQTGKGAGIGAAFGGGSQTVFGPRGAGSFIGRVTGVVAGLFMLTSITLAYLSTSRSDSVEKAAEALKTEKAKQVENVSLTDKKEDKAAEKAPAPTPAPAKDTDLESDAQKAAQGTDEAQKAPASAAEGEKKAEPVKAETSKAPVAAAPEQKKAPAPNAEKAAAPKEAAPKADVGAETPAAAPEPAAPAEPAAQ